MPHAAVHTPLPPPPPARRRPAGQHPRLQLLASADAATTKPAAAKLFARFAARSPLPAGTLRAQLIPDATWKRADRLLGPTAAQTVARLLHALDFATRTWQSEPDAIDWLLGPHIELGGATPFSLLRTESGGRAVDSLLAALEYGFPV